MTKDVKRLSDKVILESIKIDIKESISCNIEAMATSQFSSLHTSLGINYHSGKIIVECENIYKEYKLSTFYSNLKQQLISIFISQGFSKSVVIYGNESCDKSILLNFIKIHLEILKKL